MLRKLTIMFMCLTLCWTTAACGGSRSTNYGNPNSNVVSKTNQVRQGQYPVQQATYNDANGQYSLMLLNTPAGQSPVYETTDLQMASLTEEEIKASKGSYAEISSDRAVLHLTQDFKIEYVHNVTENRTNSSTGQTETVIVRRESNFWTPFAGALAGQVVGNMLFSPQYYVPPVYQGGGTMVGYGGYGRSYDRAVQQYQTRYQSPPPAVRNRQTLRTTGNLNSPSTNRTTRQQQGNTNRSTGSGAGTTNLRRSNNSSPNKRKPSFGSGGNSRSGSRRGGSSRRRR